MPEKFDWMAPWIVNILDDHGRINITPRRLVCQSVERGLARPFRWDRLLCGMSVAYPVEFVGEVLVYLSPCVVSLEVENLCDRIERRTIKRSADVVFRSTGHNDPEGMGRGDERMDDAEEVRPLCRVSTFVKPVNNEKSGGG